MMRILHVVPTYHPAVRYGGTIVSTRALVAAQVAAGHAVTVATTSVDGPHDRRELEGAARSLDGATLHYFPVGVPRRLYRSPAMARWLDAHAAEFDVVHAHAAYLWPTWRAERAARRAARPFVYSPRGMLMPDLIAERSAWVKRAWIALVERRTLARTDVVHFTSRREADGYAALGLAVAGESAIVPNGVASPAAVATAVVRDPREVLYVGRLSTEKRIETLVAALARVPDATLTVAGDDAGTGERARLEALAREAGVGDRVRFEGHVDADRRTALMARAAMLVLPSVAESFGNVVVEAMAQGCAVIVAPGVGARDVVEASAGGVVRDGEASAIAAQLRRWIDDPADRAAHGARGAAFVRTHLGWAGIAARMTAVYARAIARRDGTTMHDAAPQAGRPSAPERPRESRADASKAADAADGEASTR